MYIQPMLSIIVPVYNVEKYLSRCLYSLVDVQIPYEIIIVNDGSTDNSLSVALSFKKRFEDKLIKIVSQSNQGLSAARNTGLSQAIGNYVYFIDSDDFIDPVNFSIFAKQSIDDDLDIGIGRFSYWGTSKKYGLSEVENHQVIHNKIARGEEVYECLQNRMEVWIKIFKKDFLIKNNIKFVNGMLFEDEVFNVHIMIFSQKVKYFDIPFYFYFQREGSIVNSNDLNKYLHYYRIASKIFDLMSLSDSEKSKRIVCYRGWAFLKVALLQSYIYDKSEFELKRKEFKKILLILLDSGVIVGGEQFMIEKLITATEITAFSLLEKGKIEFGFKM